MRLDALLDAVYLAGSLWGAQVCPSSSPSQAAAPRGAIRTPGAAPAATTAFVDVNVIPMDTERVLTNHTVVIEGGKITALGPVSQVKVPVGAVRIEGRGKYLMPGLTDMHSHNYFGYGSYDKLAPRLFTFLANGITGIRFLNSGTTNPRSFEGPKMLSPRFYFPLKIEHSAKPESMTASVTAAKAAGYDFIDITAAEVYSRKTLPVVDSLLVAARRLNFPMGAHDHDTSFGKVLALGAVGGSTEHLTWFRDTLGLRKAVYSDTLDQKEADRRLAEIPALAAAVGRTGLWLTPTLDCIETKYPMSPINLLILRRMVKALHDAGVKFFLAGDAAVAREWPGVVHHELAALVRAGLTPYQALVTGTRNPAQFLGKLDSIGTVAVGKQADLVLLHGNPLANIRHTLEPAGVMIGGRWLDRAALDQGVLAISEPLSKSWLRLGVIRGGVYPYPTIPMDQREPTAQTQQLEAYVTKFEQLTDSLAAVPPSDKILSQRLQRALAAELGTLRASLIAEQVQTFDVLARMWLREQARQGHPTTVAGVAPAP